MLRKDVTFGVSSVGNIQALQLCLSSVLNAAELPSKIQIRLEGSFPSFNNYYLEQLSELARFHGIEWQMTVAKSKGIRAARDFHLDQCRTDILWMGDDDCLYDPECLYYLLHGAQALRFDSPDYDAAYICGSKGDINNRRGYSNFDLSIKGPEEIKEDCPFFYFYDKEACAGKFAQVFTADTGNILLNMPLIRNWKLKFDLFDVSTNSGGEDTIFALEVGKAGLRGFIVPSARAYHLEKPVPNFNEFAARKEMILRVGDLRKYPAEHLAKVHKALLP